jgi:hypothetical protein
VTDVHEGLPFATSVNVQRHGHDNLKCFLFTKQTYSELHFVPRILCFSTCKLGHTRFKITRIKTSFPVEISTRIHLLSPLYTFTAQQLLYCLRGFNFYKHTVLYTLCFLFRVSLTINHVSFQNNLIVFK